MIVRARYSTPLIDAIVSANVIEAVVEHLKRDTLQWSEHTRGYIMNNPWGGQKWVVFLFGYIETLPEAKQFATLGAARKWAKSELRARRSLTPRGTK